MQIGVLQAYFSRVSIGGGEIHTEQLARALRSRGHQITVFTDVPAKRREGISDLNVVEYPTPAKVNPVTELTLAQKAFQDLKECDVVVLTDDSAWRGVDLPVPTAMIFHIVWHGWVEHYGSMLEVLWNKPQALLYRHFEKKVCRKANAIVSISPNIREDLRLVGADQDKIVSIPNGVDIDRFVPRDNANEAFTVYFQGRLVEMKNPMRLVEAAEASQEPWRLVLGGNGPLRDEIERYVERHSLGNRVELLGYVPEDELPRRYAEADVFALPSRYEGMPLTILEAAASGTAILASTRAATDFVTDEIGVVVDPDSKTLAAELDRLSRQSERVSEMGRAARERAEDYAWPVIAREYEQLFGNLQAGKT